MTRSQLKCRIAAETNILLDIGSRWAKLPVRQQRKELKAARERLLNLVDEWGNPQEVSNGH